MTDSEEGLEKHVESSIKQREKAELENRIEKRIMRGPLQRDRNLTSWSSRKSRRKQREACPRGNEGRLSVQVLPRT